MTKQQPHGMSGRGPGTQRRIGVCWWPDCPHPPWWKAIRPGGRRTSTAILFSCPAHLEELKRRRTVLVEPIDPKACFPS